MAEKKTIEIPGLKVTPIDKVDEDHLDLSDSSLKRMVTTFNDASAGIWENKRLASLTKLIESEGENDLRQVGRVEVKAFDSSFLDALEVGLAAVGKILANPRTFIKETTEIENVEKAKKVSVVSIQHFATHSQYLRTIAENGEVIPDKILTVHSETNTAIYENRFVMTLIKRCLSFIDQRYKFIEEHGETLDSDELFIKNKTLLGGVNYDVTMRIKASVPSSDAGNSEKNDQLLNRLEGYRTRCSDYLRSPFMTQMKGAKDVTSPVHMTNMLLKHPDYHAAYLLWEFIEQYESLGVSYDVHETLASFDEEYLKRIYELIGNAILTLHTRHEKEAQIVESKAKRLTPQVLFTLDDITYDDGRFVYDAYPEAEAQATSPFDVLDEEQRKSKVERLGAHLSVQEKASGVVKKKIQKTKDQRAFAAALSRDQEEDVHQEELKRQAKAKRMEELRQKKAEAEQKRLEKQRKMEEEERAYQAAKARLEAK